jgi:hypothetical protein
VEGGEDPELYVSKTLAGLVTRTAAKVAAYTYAFYVDRLR